MKRTVICLVFLLILSSCDRERDTHPDVVDQVVVEREGDYPPGDDFDVVDNNLTLQANDANYGMGPFIRIYDREAGVVCWIYINALAEYEDLGLGCLPIKDTKLK